MQLSTRHLAACSLSTTKSDEIVERIRRQLQAPDRSKQKRSDVDEMFVLDWNELFKVFARVFEIVVGFVIACCSDNLTPDIAREDDPADLLLRGSRCGFISTCSGSTGA